MQSARQRQWTDNLGDSEPWSDCKLRGRGILLPANASAASPWRPAAFPATSPTRRCASVPRRDCSHGSLVPTRDGAHSPAAGTIGCPSPISTTATTVGASHPSVVRSAPHPHCFLLHDGNADAGFPCHIKPRQHHSQRCDFPKQAYQEFSLTPFCFVCLAEARMLP
jgi:hypothetical protein